MIDLNAIQIFVHVIEAEGFSGASRVLAVPKSTLSRKVQELETSLGTALVRRNTRGLTLTETGRTFYEHCRQVLADAAAAVQDARSGSAGLQGVLRVTAPVGIGLSMLQPSLMRFMSRYPKLRIDLALSDERLSLVRGGFDLALRMGALTDSELRVRRLGTFERLLCASPRYIADAGEPQGPGDLRRHACIVIRREPASWELDGPDGHSQVPVFWRLCVNNVVAVRMAALEHGGIASLPTHLVQDDLRHGRLVRVLKDWRPPATDLSALFPPGRGGSPAAKAFVDYLIRDLFSEARSVAEDAADRLTA
ncbi:MAG: LysR family transcriptional regulator [Alphaproteobacteria bacterium]|nr:LysR family transcriptional regulator [Alphaproteobacteria bacterium]